ncbi:hypothetical protein B0H67DRAFT_599080 [Lasiosphaeris hirsuta]|uniref:Uncharacterized protein n=1 Tax=Lasiosphaeris hirsuta TaxID=260670 RepID=A0AA40DZ97_9PEZI|nr:hypothetical protein B0H67DRAFT_599080 [Lasiosphaeris hirsuta]
MTALAAALGAVIGYIGAEVADEAVFDRLLWPHRFYNSQSPATTAKLALLMSMAGPLHGAALAALDHFRDHGLYLGHQRGDMLGTSFFSNQAIQYYYRSSLRPQVCSQAKEIRNGFWVHVLRFASGAVRPRMEKVESRSERVRAHRCFFTLHLEHCPGLEMAGDSVVVSERRPTFRTLLGILISELSAIAVATAAGLWHRFGASAGSDSPPLWLIGFLCIPLFLRLLAAAATVRREELESPSLEERSGALPGFRDMVEVDCSTIGFILITAPPGQIGTILQFFRHYGHPKRETRYDRIREIVCIAVVYAFVLYFPAGLLLLAWMNEPTQYLWLGHQVYCILAMHLVRVCGWQGTGRTEERVAAALVRDKTVYIEGDSCYVKATLVTETVQSVAAGKEMLSSILRANSALLPGHQP